MIVRRILAAAAAAALALLAACSDGTPRIYEQGKYKGAAVKAPYDSPQFAGNRAAWESQIDARTRRQDEYTRMGTR